MKCIKCQKEIPDDAVFCCYCGRKQAGMHAVKPKKYRGKKGRRTRGTGSIYLKKIEDGKLKRPVYADLPDGTNVGRFEDTPEGWAEAESVLEEAVAKFRSGKLDTGRYNMTFEQVFEEWFEHYQRQQKQSKHPVSEETLKRYRRGFEAFKPLHTRKIRDIRTGDYQVIIDDCQEMGKSYDTLSKYVSVVRQVSEWAIRNEIIENNPADHIELPPRDAEERVPYSRDDIRLLTEDGSETAMIILMLAYTGMRPNELFTLPLKDYHETYVVGGEKTEAGRNRLIPIRPIGRKYFEYFADRAEPDGLLISGYSGNKVYANFRGRDYIKLRDRLGIDRMKTPYSARHYFATDFSSQAKAKGVSDKDLTRIMGHTDPKADKPYLHKNPDDPAEIARREKEASVLVKELEVLYGEK